MRDEYNLIMAFNKKIALVVLIVAVLVFGLVIAWIILHKEKVPSGEITEEETGTERQLRELEELRKEALPLTEEEAHSQLGELEELREGIDPLSEEEDQKQLEELEELRQSQ